MTMLLLVWPMVLLFVTLHELGHAYTANFLGDPTPREQGRLSFNPLRHLSLYGSVLVPVMLFMLHGPMFGWAKPVQVKPDKFREQWLSNGFPLVAAAGPAVNFSLALLGGIAYRLLSGTGLLSELVLLGVYINIILALFNLIPVPPLDGSKVILPILPRALRNRFTSLTGADMLILLGLFFIFILPTLAPAIGHAAKFFMHLFAGTSELPALLRR